MYIHEAQNGTVVQTGEWEIVLYGCGSRQIFKGLFCLSKNKKIKRRIVLDICGSREAVYVDVNIRADRDELREKHVRGFESIKTFACFKI